MISKRFHVGDRVEIDGVGGRIGNVIWVHCWSDKIRDVHHYEAEEFIRLAKAKYGDGWKEEYFEVGVGLDGKVSNFAGYRLRVVESRGNVRQSKPVIFVTKDRDHKAGDEKEPGSEGGKEGNETGGEGHSG